MAATLNRAFPHNGATALGRGYEGWLVIARDRRPLHSDKAGALQVVDEPPGDESRPSLVGVVDALAALVSIELVRLKKAGVLPFPMRPA
jgi:hypothetical protein